MLSNSRRRAPAPSPIHIPRIRQRQEDGGKFQIDPEEITPALPTSPLSAGSRSTGWPFAPSTTTTFHTQYPTSVRAPSPTSQTIVVASKTRLSTIKTTTTSRSPTRTSFVTIVQTQTLGLLSPEDKGDKSPDDTSTVFVTLSRAPQFVTVTARPTESTKVTLPAADTTQSATSNANPLPPGAIAPLISLSVIAGVSAIITVAIVIWRRREKKKKKLQKNVGSLQQVMTKDDDSRFGVVSDLQPILPRRNV